MKFVVRNHNHTSLGEFDDIRQATTEAQEYTYQTGNAAYVDLIDKEKTNEIQSISGDVVLANHRG